MRNKDELDFNLILMLRLSAALFPLYDHVLSLGREINLVWTKPWSVSKIMFLWNRYLGTILFIIQLAGCVKDLNSHKMCHHFLRIAGVFAAIIIWSMQANMVFRVFAMHRRSLRNLLFVFGTYGCQILTVLVALAFFYRPSPGQTGPPIQSTTFCVLLTINSNVFAYWLPLIAMDTLLLLFVGVASMRRARQSSGSQICPTTNLVWNSLVYDSIRYFTITISLYTLNVIMWLKLQPHWIEVPANFAVSTTVTLGCRIILNLREVYYLPFAYDGDDITQSWQIEEPRRSLSSVQLTSYMGSLREGSDNQ